MILSKNIKLNVSISKSFSNSSKIEFSTSSKEKLNPVLKYFSIILCCAVPTEIDLLLCCVKIGLDSKSSSLLNRKFLKQVSNFPTLVADT